MKLFAKLIILLISFATVSFADIGQVKDKFFSSIENFLDGSFEHTDFTIKSTEHTKPEISVETFKPLSETDDGLTFSKDQYLHMMEQEKQLILDLEKEYFQMMKI